MISLTDLRSTAVALDWHEAVAAGAALATLIAEAQAPACPRPGDVALLPTGELRVTGPGHLDGPPASGVALVLARFLEAAPCPAELRQLVEAYAGDPRTDRAGQEAVASLASELAFFERPGRRDVLAAVALRAEPALERARHAAALDALTERTRHAAGAPAATPAPHRAGDLAEAPADDVDVPHGWDPAAEHGVGRLIVPAAVGIVAFLGVAYVAASWFDRPAPVPAHSTAEEGDFPVVGPEQPRAPAVPGSPGPASSSAVGSERPAGSAPSASAPSVPKASSRTPTPSVPAPTAASGPAPAAPAPPARRTVDVVVAERDGRVVPSPIAPVRTAPRAVPTGRVFTIGDAQVTPAVLIRPHLPEQPPPDVPEEQIGTLEFVVGESGAVEHVHLISPANRYHERMLVAAAKTWVFQPATREGRPVRFRTRIRVTL